MSSYSLDVIKKLAFEKEIEHIKNGHKDKLNEDEKLLVSYMSNRIEEIEKEYGEPQVRGKDAL